MNFNIKFVYRFFCEQRLQLQSASFSTEKACKNAAKRNMKRWRWVDTVNIVKVTGDRNITVEVF